MKQSKDAHKPALKLDERFGSSARIVDAVLGEICALKPVPEGNKTRLLHMINVVEQAWLDLKKT